MHSSKNSQPMLCWRSDLSATRTADADGSCFHVEDPQRRKFFRIGFAEYTLLSQFDGRRSLPEVAESANRALGTDAFSEADVLAVIQWGLQNGLLTLRKHDAPASGPSAKEIGPNSQASGARANGSDVAGDVQLSDDHSLARRAWESASPPPKRKIQWSLLSIRIPLGCPDRWCARVLPWVEGLFGKTAFIAWLILIAMAGSEVAVNWPRFVASTADILVPSNWLGLGLAWVLLKAVHEAAHGLVCKRHGGEVREVGIAFIFFAPVAYVDVTSCWRFASRWPRIQTAAAGMYAEMALAALAVLVAGQADSLVEQHFLDNVAVMASVTTVLFNINPLSRFDGYYILTDFCRVPNLYTRGQKAAQQFAARWLLGDSSSGERPSWLLTAYGFATWLWSLSVMLGIVVAAAMYWHGLGVFLSALIAVSWLRSTFTRLMHAVRQSSSQPGRSRFGGLARLTLLVAACAAILLFVPWPFANTAPGVIEFTSRSVVRTESAGFVVRVLVEDGETVIEGQPLIELQNEELEREMRDLELSIEQSRLRERLAVEQHDTAAGQIEQQQRDSLQRRLAERHGQVERLTLRAPIAGIVSSRQLATLPGSFVAAGAELLSIGDPSQREFVAAVQQEDLAVVQSSIERPVVVHLYGRGDVPGRLLRIHPRASTIPEHPCLCAPFGGPLPVQSLPDEAANRSRSTNNFELLQPHFRLTYSLDDQSAQQPFAGEIGWINLDHRQSCGEHLVTWLSCWANSSQR